MFHSDDPLLCISNDLVCDGIRQCPLGNGMLSDEDENLCRRHRLNSQDYNVSFNNFKMNIHDNDIIFYKQKTLKLFSFSRIFRKIPFGNILHWAFSKTFLDQLNQLQRSHP
jgi:hypothetical protein